MKHSFWHRSRRWAIAPVLAAFLLVPGALAQQGPILLDHGTTQEDVPEPIVAFPDGTEIMVEPSKGPVQGIISLRTEVIEGGEKVVYVGGLIAYQSRDGWMGAEQPFYWRASGTFLEDAEVEQGFRIVLDPPLAAGEG